MRGVAPRKRVDERTRGGVENACLFIICEICDFMVAAESYGEGVQYVVQVITGVFCGDAFSLLFVVLVEMRLYADHMVLVVDP